MRKWNAIGFAASINSAVIYAMRSNLLLALVGVLLAWLNWELLFREGK